MLASQTDLTIEQKQNRELLEKAVSEVNKTISTALDTIQQIYTTYKLHFHVEKQYAHKVLMAIVSPVDLKIIYDVKKAEYFSVGFSPVVKNSGTQGRHKEQIDSFKKNLSIGLSNIKQKIRQQSQPNTQSKPQMLSILNKVSQTNSQNQSLAGYYKGVITSNIPQEPKKPYVPFKKLKNDLSYPSTSMKFYDQIRQETKQNSKNKLALSHKIQQELSKWVVKELTAGRKITRYDVKSKALQIRDNPAFKASRTWLRQYFQRYPHIKNLVMQCEVQQQRRQMQQQKSQPSSSSQSKSMQQDTKLKPSSQYSDYQQIQEGSAPRKKKQVTKAKKLQKIQDTNGDQGKQDQKAIYDDGQQKIIIFKGITNQVTQSKYTIGRRHRKSYVNGNGYNFKNHSRFKDAYFNDLNKMKQVNNVIIVKANQEKQKQQQNKTNQQMKQKNNEKQQKQSKHNKEDVYKNNGKNDNVDSKSNSKSKRKYRDYDQDSGSRLKSYLNLMRYETVKIDPPKQ